MTSTTTASETCSCGATFTASGWAPHVSADLRSWREGHKHTESVGICGNKPPRILVDIPAPHCELKAGHEGMHADGKGCHWVERQDVATEMSAYGRGVCAREDGHDGECDY